MERSAALYDLLKPDFAQQASYAVAMAYRIRYSMQFNAREAIHLIELRSSPQGHPSYRRSRIGNASPHRRRGRA